MADTSTAPDAPDTTMTDNSNPHPNPDSNPEPTKSPSPTPTPGLLATQLHSVFARALTNTTKACSYGNFAACFPTPAARQPEILRSVWTQIIGKIETKARSEFEGIMEERDVVRGLNELEQLVADAKRRKEEWAVEGNGENVPPHTLPPEALFGAHLAPELEGIKREVEGRIEGVSRENERLVEEIEGQREEVEALVRQLEGVVRDLEDANGTLGAIVDEQGLRQEVVDIQKDVTGSKL